MITVFVEKTKWEEAWEKFKSDLFKGYNLCSLHELSGLRKEEVERRIERLKAELEESSSWVGG